MSLLDAAPVPVKVNDQATETASVSSSPDVIVSYMITSGILLTDTAIVTRSLT